MAQESDVDPETLVKSLLLQNQQDNDTKHPLVNKIQKCSNKGPVPLKKRAYYKNSKIGYSLKETLDHKS
jgi:hypothetical protein